MSGVSVSCLEVNGKTYSYYPVACVEGAKALPFCMRVVLENILRNAPDAQTANVQAQRLVSAALAGQAGEEIEFAPARVLFQDFTGVPVFVDFAVMREACQQLGGNPARINPQVSTTLVVDHSVIADEFGCEQALDANMALEYERNRERYEFLKWSQSSFDNVEIVPPGQGICHQMNVEHISSVVCSTSSCAADMPSSAVDMAEAATASTDTAEAATTSADTAETATASADTAELACATSDENYPLAYFDTVVGTDSHTPTVNGIGVLGWGVGGIEAEAAALGQPIPMLVPRVIGVELTGALQDGVSAMDAALTFAQMLRAEGVVGCFVECFGEGVASLSATQRACISNMTPEYGCTCTLFPVDERTLEYLRVTGRSADTIDLVEAYAKAQGLWNDPQQQRSYAQVLTLDLGSVKRSLAGPSRPHDRIDFARARDTFRTICASRNVDNAHVQVHIGGHSCKLTHGAIAIAAITSCTTATDPAMMVACGLLARNAADAGLAPAPWVKTILAPGSRATELLLQRAGLLEPLSKLGFYTCGFGCMSCIGNSGPILSELHDVADTIELASVLSGNRNFEGRISPDVAQNYLSAPAGVVAYALAGTLDFDFDTQPLGQNRSGQDVFLADIWPTDAEVADILDAVVDNSLYETGNANLFAGDAAWNALDAASSDTFAWDKASTYVRRAPYFDGMSLEAYTQAPIQGARVLVNVGDFITTDHISPAGAIAADSAAAAYLRNAGLDSASFNTYGSRRGNHEVMMRGTFANVKLENLLADGRKGGWTKDMIDGATKLIFDTSQHYEADAVPSIVLAGKMYGSGSSRDWAAKGPALLGVRAVIAQSYERIHRSNLIGMGVLPLQFAEGENAQVLGLDGSELFDIDPVAFPSGLPEPAQVAVHATRSDGTKVDFCATVRIDTPTEGAYYQHGGILQYVLRNLASE